MTTTVWIILAGAVVTFLTRIGGDLVLSRFERIHPRLEAALNAVPAAVLTTLVAPVATTGGIAEAASLVVAGGIFLRGGGMMAGFVAGAAVLIALRNLIG
ncbi:MAG: AzlD domain-containing protein [Rhizobiaceae bacterium]|nr:AzlD domain-containing protein [Rhizobiaceae bacterium]